MEDFSFLSTILFGFLINVVLVNWDILWHSSGEYYLDWSEISMPLSFLSCVVFLFLGFILAAATGLFIFRLPLKYPFCLNWFHYGSFLGKISGNLLAKYVQTPEILSLWLFLALCTDALTCSSGQLIWYYNPSGSWYTSIKGTNPGVWIRAPPDQPLLRLSFFLLLPHHNSDGVINAFPDNLHGTSQYDSRPLLLVSGIWGNCELHYFNSCGPHQLKGMRS